MPKFHETMLGRRFFEGDFPELVRTFKSLHKDCEVLIRLKEDELMLRQKELALKERELNLIEKELK